MFVVDLKEQEEIKEELEKIEEISYVANLYNCKDYIVRMKIKKGISLKQLDNLHDVCYNINED